MHEINKKKTNFLHFLVVIFKFYFLLKRCSFFQKNIFISCIVVCFKASLRAYLELTLLKFLIYFIFFFLASSVQFVTFCSHSLHLKPKQFRKEEKKGQKNKISGHQNKLSIIMEIPVFGSRSQRIFAENCHSGFTGHQSVILTFCLYLFFQ